MTMVGLDTADMWMIGACCVYLVGVWLVLLCYGVLDSRLRINEFPLDLVVAVIWPIAMIAGAIVEVGDWFERIRPRLPCIVKEAWFWMTALFRPYSLGRRLGRRRI